MSKLPPLRKVRTSTSAVRCASCSEIGKPQRHRVPEASVPLDSEKHEKGLQAINVRRNSLSGTSSFHDSDSNRVRSAGNWAAQAASIFESEGVQEIQSAGNVALQATSTVHPKGMQSCGLAARRHSMGITPLKISRAPQDIEHLFEKGWQDSSCLTNSGFLTPPRSKKSVISVPASPSPPRSRRGSFCVPERSSSGTRQVEHLFKQSLSPGSDSEMRHKKNQSRCFPASRSPSPKSSKPARQLAEASDELSRMGTSKCSTGNSSSLSWPLQGMENTSPRTQADQKAALRHKKNQSRCFPASRSPSPKSSKPARQLAEASDELSRMGTSKCSTGNSSSLSWPLQGMENTSPRTQADQKAALRYSTMEEIPGDVLFQAISLSSIGYEAQPLAVLARRDFNEINLRHHDLCTALHPAARKGLEKVCTQLLDCTDFRDVNAQDSAGRTALHVAAGAGHLEICELLLEHERFSDVNAETKVGATALHCAACCGNSAVCQVLLDHSDFNAADARDSGGETALHWAAWSGNTAACQVIVEAPRFHAINERDNAGRTSLHSAASHGQKEACLAIWKNPRCKRETKAFDGSTALEVALTAGHFDLHKELLCSCSLNGLE